MVLENISDFASTPILDTEFTVGAIVLITLFIVVGFVVAKIVKIIFNKKVAPQLPENTSKNLSKFLYYGIIIVSFLAAITTQGIDLTGIMVAAGIFGVVIGFATQSVVSNLVSGIFMMIEKPAKIGDQIEIQDMDLMGYVVDVGLFSTKIRKYDWTVVRIPNDKLFTSNMRNLYASSARRIDVSVGISYSDDIQKAISVIKNSIKKKMPYVIREPAPEFYVEALADSSVNIRVLVRHPPKHWNDVSPMLLSIIKDALDEAGIEIPFPQRVVTQIRNKRGV